MTLKHHVFTPLQQAVQWKLYGQSRGDPMMERHGVPNVTMPSQNDHMGPVSNRPQNLLLHRCTRTDVTALGSSAAVPGLAKVSIIKPSVRDAKPASQYAK